MDFDLKPGDIAARGNFCTLDKNGMISDRRAGRISTDEGKKLCAILEAIEIDGVKIIVQSVREHRLVTVFRGAGLDDELNDSDPQLLGVPPRAISPLDPRAAHTARIVNQFLVQARERLASHRPANMILLRGFSKKPDFPGLGEIYKLKAAAIASYPMYRGLAKVVGMDVLKTGAQLSDELSTLEQNYKSFDYFFLHVKGADSAGEDGDFKRKVSVIEEVDKAIPRIMDLKPDVLIITGDHSTPAAMSAHSWHPVPCLLYSKWCRPDGIAKFGEVECRTGSLGQMPASSLMPLAMAHAFKLTKFGA
jgi:2,3-bisphosphoglycerate-independent phosphoglycerate mutase